MSSWLVPDDPTDSEPIPRFDTTMSVSVEFSLSGVNAEALALLFGMPVVDASIMADKHIERGDK